MFRVRVSCSAGGVPLTCLFKTVELAHVDVHYQGGLTSIAVFDAVVPPCYYNSDADSPSVCSVVVGTLRKDNGRRCSRRQIAPFLKGRTLERYCP